MAYSRIIYGDVVGQWVAREIQGMYWREQSQAIGLERDGRLVAGCIFEDWNGRSIVAHWALRGRPTPGYLWLIADYPFHQLGVFKVIAPVGSDNQRMMDLAVKIGFREEGRIRDAQPNGDIVIFTLLEQDCVFLGERFGQKRPTTCTT